MAYLEAYRAGRWRERLTVWPLVLTVTPTLARATALRRVTEDVLERDRDRQRLAAVEFDFAALGDLQAPEGPLGAIWQIAGRVGRHALIPAEAATNPPTLFWDDTEGDSIRLGSASREGERCEPYQHQSGTKPR